jgi:hypothetical protein
MGLYRGAGLLDGLLESLQRKGAIALGDLFADGFNGNFCSHFASPVTPNAIAHNRQNGGEILLWPKTVG